MRLKLKLLDGENIDHKIKDNDLVTIGRSPKCSVVIPKDGMSRQHCQLEIVNGEVFVTDLGSTNGVFIDGVRIPPNTRTHYSSYLTLAFGAVHSLQVDAEDFSVPDYSVLQTKSTIPGKAEPTEKTGTDQHGPKAQKRPIEEKTRSKVLPKEDKSKFWIMNGIILLVVAGLVYWYVKTDSNVDTPDFESIPDMPETSSSSQK